MKLLHYKKETKEYLLLSDQNLRPYFKFTLPTLEILAAERDIWDQANSDSFDPNQVLFLHIPIISKATYYII
jgi:hypothetical protein